MRISKYKFASFEHSIDQIGKTHHLAQLNRLKEYDFGFKMWDKPPGGGFSVKFRIYVCQTTILGVLNNCPTFSLSPYYYIYF
jgi:hypothetical protein